MESNHQHPALAAVNRHISKRTGPHYGWVIVLTGLAVSFACLGLGRFALGMLLPTMGSSLGLNYAQMGLIGTGNFTGYMVSVMLAGFFVKRLGARCTITVGLVLVGGSMLLVSQAAGFLTVLLLYVATGLGSGFANVPMMGLVSHWFVRRARGRAAGTMLSGNGIAIVFAGFYVPYVNTQVGVEGWRSGWLTIGLIALAVAVLALLLLRNDPAQKGLAPMGAADPPPTAPVLPSDDETYQSTRRAMVRLGIIYSLFGASYVVYATFIVTALVNERGMAENVAGTFWAAVGALSVFSGPLFGWLSDKLGRKVGLTVVYALFTAAYTLVAADLPALFLYASIVIFGLTVWSIPSIMAAAVGDCVGPMQAAQAFGFITLFFGAGQICGPAAAGFLAEASGSFSSAFWMCAALTATAVILTLFLRVPGSEDAVCTN